MSFDNLIKNVKESRQNFICITAIVSESNHVNFFEIFTLH